MPLSEHEQRMLEQMERALYAEDPKFATALEGSGLRTYTRRRVYQAVAGFLVGIALLMAGMVAQQIWVSVVGFRKPRVLGVRDRFESVLCAAELGGRPQAGRPG
ncbi:DUF3040 domain-containing protein, partial [Streptomyces sp. NPDC002156]